MSEKVPFIYEEAEDSEGCQLIGVDADGQAVDLSEPWWSEGSMSCDCNRVDFLPGSCDHDGSCGNEIEVHTVTPLVDGAPDGWTLRLED